MSASIPNKRRRLTVGPGSDKVNAEECAQKSDLDAKSILLDLKGRSIQQLLEETAEKSKTARDSKTSRKSRRSSIAGVTDKKAEKHATYGDKERVAEGDTITEEDQQNLRVGIVCRKGKKPDSPNQDSFAWIHDEDRFDIFIVFDGHGPCGHNVSNFAREVLQKLILSNPVLETDPASALNDAFLQCQNLIQNSGSNLDASMSGTTCTVAYLPRAGPLLGKVVVAHVGDSRAVLVNCGTSPAMSADLTEDHKPNLPREKERIESRGGRVIFDGYFNHRVFADKAPYPGLNMSRALGDVVAHLKAGLTAEPEITIVDVGKYTHLLVCSDGVWEFIQSEEAAKMVAQKSTDKECQAAAEALALEAWSRWMEDSENTVSDDITAMVIGLKGGR